MSELHSSAETAEPAAAPARDASDKPQHGEASPGTRRDAGPGALAIEDQLPARQDSRAAAWDDSPDYDEADLAAEYDGDLEALAADDHLPVRGDSRPATWDDNPEQDEVGLAAGYGGGLEALTTEDRLAARQDSRTATWGGRPDYDEAAPGAEHDGDLGALTTGDHALGTGRDHALDSGKGDQDQAAAGEAPAAGQAGDLPAEASGISAVAEDGPLAGSSSEATRNRHAVSAHETTAREVPGGSEPSDAITGQAARPGQDHPVPGTAPEASIRQQIADLRDQVQAQVDERLQAAETRYQASLDNLKAEYEAGKAQDQQQIDDLRAELQAVKDDRPQPAPDVPGSTGRDADQPRFGDRKLPAAQADATEVKSEGDRPGLWSNAKTALYGGIGAMGAGFVFSEFFPNVPSSVVVVATGAVSIASLLVPVLREGRKGKHDNPPDKP